MNILKRLSNLWKIAGMEIPEEVAKEAEVQPSKDGNFLSAIYDSKPKAQIIPYKKVDPVKAITEEEV